MRREIGHLLIVDDDPVNRQLMTHHFERAGHTVSTADSGEQALDVIRGNDFDLILLDIMLPGMSGLDVLRNIRETHTLMELPVIIVTGHDDSREVVDLSLIHI